VWKAAEVNITGPNARKIMEPQPSLRIFTRRHYSITAVTADKPRVELPDGQKASDKQLADTFGPFLANAGTYEIRGNEITIRPTLAKSPKGRRRQRGRKGIEVIAESSCFRASGYSFGR